MDEPTPFEFERLITETTMVLDEQLSLEHEQFEKAAEENLIFNMTTAEDNVITERLLMTICRGNLPEGSPHFKIAMDGLKDEVSITDRQVSDDDGEDADTESILTEGDIEGNVTSKESIKSEVITSDYEKDVEMKNCSPEEQTNIVSSGKINCESSEKS